MKIGIMGGTFNPIHNGHLIVGKTALEQFCLDEVWYMPNGRPPHKAFNTIEATAEDRLNMTKLAIRDFPKFRVEEYELTNTGTSYSYRTMEHFHKVYPEHDFYFIVGADSLFTIESWVHPERLFPLCTILAAFRDEIDTTEEMEVQIRHLQDKYSAKIELLSSPLMDISSHELRQDVAEGKSISASVPLPVEEYIREKGLYGSKNH